MRAGFEWKTKLGLFGIPLVCVAFGMDQRGSVRVKAHDRGSPLTVGPREWYAQTWENVL
jgi:hypothetical protein